MKYPDLLTTGELAKKLGVTRVTVFNRIKKGKISARKIGKNYFIRIEDANAILKNELTDKIKSEINATVDRVFREYGETIRQLGEE